MSKCECGAETYIKKTQECRRCYYSRYNSEHREQYNAYARAAYVPVPIIYTVAAPETGPCSRLAARQRLHRYRGKALGQLCPCGADAEAWSYRGNSGYEMEDGRRKWSSHVKDYDALCRTCNGERHAFFEKRVNTPAAATTFLSPAGGTE